MITILLSIKIMSSKSNYQIIRLQQHNNSWMEALDILYRAFAIEEGHTTPPEQFTDYVRQRLDDEQMLLSLAMAHEDSTSLRPIGYALVFDVMEHPFIPDWERSGYITQMFVQADHRQQGVGQFLFDYSMDWLAERNVPQVLLNIHPENALAERFWQKQGFITYLKRMKRLV